MRRRLPERSFFTIEDFAAELQTTPDALHDFAANVHLHVSEMKLDGRQRCGVTAAERARFLGQQEPAQSQGQPSPHRRRYETALLLLAAVIHGYAGKDESLMQPYTLFRDLEQQGARSGGGPRLHRSDDTFASVFREAMRLYGDHANRAPPPMAEPDDRLALAALRELALETADQSPGRAELIAWAVGRLQEVAAAAAEGLNGSTPAPDPIKVAA